MRSDRQTFGHLLPFFSASNSVAGTSPQWRGNPVFPIEHWHFLNKTHQYGASLRLGKHLRNGNVCHRIGELCPAVTHPAFPISFCCRAHPDFSLAPLLGVAMRGCTGGSFLCCEDADPFPLRGLALRPWSLAGKDCALLNTGRL